MNTKGKLDIVAKTQHQSIKIEKKKSEIRQLDRNIVIMVIICNDSMVV